MKSTASPLESTQITGRILIGLVNELLGAYPDPDNPLPPGPWDPIIRKTLERMGPWPEPWRFGIEPEILRLIARRDPRVWDTIGGPWGAVALNPQHLPPRVAIAAAFAEAAVERFELMQDVADAVMPEEGGSGIGNVIARFVDDVCGNELRRKYPLPPPKGDERFTALELAVIASRFERAASATVHEGLCRAFSSGGAKLRDAALARAD